MQHLKQSKMNSLISSSQDMFSSLSIYQNESTRVIFIPLGIYSSIY